MRDFHICPLSFCILCVFNKINVLLLSLKKKKTRKGKKLIRVALWASSCVEKRSEQVEKGRAGLVCNGDSAAPGRRTL